MCLECVHSTMISAFSSKQYKKAWWILLAGLHCILPIEFSLQERNELYNGSYWTTDLLLNNFFFSENYFPRMFIHEIPSKQPTPLPKPSENIHDYPINPNNRYINRRNDLNPSLSDLYSFIPMSGISSSLLSSNRRPSTTREHRFWNAVLRAQIPTLRRSKNPVGHDHDRQLMNVETSDDRFNDARQLLASRLPRVERCGWGSEEEIEESTWRVVDSEERNFSMRFKMAGFLWESWRQFSEDNIRPWTC